MPLNYIRGITTLDFNKLCFGYKEIIINTLEWPISNINEAEPS